ncbi:endolytic transglycosylase MltG [Clostridium sp. D53t1_180928_C8]|uniref:endolytic transglycosylase MltG n=1 Tax=Clostridium sp. D53t1_180928_C8 TaxID=2787101 RepID=UPI0018AC5260|nr:endolytic transglycosylase MltG [Clostridium sp. D53t1_180928_C8]
MKKRAKNTGRALIILLLIVVIAIASIFISTIRKPLKISQSEVVNVEEGDSFYSIINRLSNEKKIKSPFIIKIYAKLTRLDLEVVPGSHTLDETMSLNDVAKTLKDTNNANTITLTIPEGFNVEDIAARVEENGICTKDEFLSAIKSYPLPAYVSDNSDKRYNLEGFLFPDTYNFEIGVKPEYIIETMIKRFEEVWAEVTEGMDIKQEDIEKVINVASIIEKEARVDEDRPLIASVIYNRLKQGMPLQIDATVIYAHGYYIENVRNRHLAIESKYNTYLHKGLPVGPICNPGEPSIKAALHPSDTNYLFYLLASDNEHYFTDNYDDFLKKKEELGY